MLVCLVLSVEEKQGIIEVTEKRERAATTTLLDPWQQALTRGRFEATRWCLPKSQVHKRLTKILRLNISQQDHKEQLSLPRSSATKSTGSSSWTTSRAVALMMYCWAVSLTTTSSWGRHRLLSRHLKQTLQKYVTPSRRCRARGARRGEVTRVTTVLHLLVCEHLYKISVAQMWSYFRREGKES